MAGENILAKDIGGLPVGVWALVVIGGVAVGWFLLRPKTTAAPATTGTPGAVYGLQGPPGVPGDVGPPGPPGTTPNTANYWSSNGSQTLQDAANYFGGSWTRIRDWNVGQYPLLATFGPTTPIPAGWKLLIFGSPPSIAPGG